jgi:superfamily II DNA or RNA helicase
MFTDNYYDIELNEHSKLAEQSSKINIKLKPHQLTALNKAIEMENKGIIRYKLKDNNIISPLSNINKNNIIEISTNVGIFGDIVGYGKTFIALSLIALNDINNIHINNNLTEIYNNIKNYNYFSISTTNNLIAMNIIRSTLIIVPRGPVYSQWENMIRTNTKLKILAINNLLFIKSNLPKYDGTNMNEIIDFYNSYDIVLIKNTTLSLFFNNYYNDNNFNIINNWKRVIIDEAHDIINNLKVNINYHYLWLISATYEKIVDKLRKTSNNSLIISKDVMTHYINFMIVKNNIKFIKNSFKLPEPIEKVYLCKLSNNINIIKNFISDSILEKLNANDISGAIKELGGKNETEEEIIELVSKELRRELNNKELERNYITNLDISQELKTLKLKNINNDIANQEEKIKNLTERISYISSKTCAICMELITNPIMIECMHVFCGSCLIRWLNTNKNCPNCRTCINSPDKLIAIVDNNNENKEVKEELLSKEETLLNIIKSKENGRFLIFSKNENSFEKIKSVLYDTNYKFELLKGNTSHMMNILNKFKSGEINIILLNTQYAGSGIDISDATDIIIFHNMGIDKQQAVGRAQRVGRTTELYIHNLCYEHEL